MRAAGVRRAGAWLAMLAVVTVAVFAWTGVGSSAGVEPHLLPSERSEANHFEANQFEASQARLVEVKMGLESMSKSDRDTLWRRVDEYATVDALQEFCGRKLNLQRRTWAAVSPCVETKSLRRVANVFRSKKAEYLKGWETNYADDEKKKTVCDTWKPKLIEYQKVIESHISEARSLCDACIFC